MITLENIHEIIFRGYEEKVTGDTFELHETGKKATCTKARFRKSTDVLVYKFDKTPKRDGENIRDKFPIFNDLPSLKSMCDFILFYSKNDRMFAVLCNLKSGNAANNADQLKAGKIFAEFIVETAKRYKRLEKADVYYKEVVFSSKALFKGSTQPGKNPRKNPRNYSSNNDGCDVCDLDAICHP